MGRLEVIKVGFKILEGSKTSMEHKLTEFKAANPDAKLEYITARGPEGGKGLLALFEIPNGVSEVIKDKTVLDQKLLKENVNLNKQIDTQKKQMGLLENTIKDLQDAIAEAIERDTKGNSIIAEKEKIINSLKEENESLKDKLRKLITG